jgi:hypothetical protein
MRGPQGGSPNRPKKYGTVLEDFWDGLVSESRRKEKGTPLKKIKADFVKRGRLRE